MQSITNWKTMQSYAKCKIVQIIKFCKIKMQISKMYKSLHCAKLYIVQNYTMSHMMQNAKQCIIMQNAKKCIISWLNTPYSKCRIMQFFTIHNFQIGLAQCASFDRFSVLFNHRLVIVTCIASSFIQTNPRLT